MILHGPTLNHNSLGGWRTSRRSCRSLVDAARHTPPAPPPRETPPAAHRQEPRNRDITQSGFGSLDLSISIRCLWVKHGEVSLRFECVVGQRVRRRRGQGGQRPGAGRRGAARPVRRPSRPSRGPSRPSRGPSRPFRGPSRPVRGPAPRAARSARPARPAAPPTAGTLLHQRAARRPRPLPPVRYVVSAAPQSDRRVHVHGQTPS